MASNEKLEEIAEKVIHLFDDEIGELNIQDVCKVFGSILLSIGMMTDSEEIIDVPNESIWISDPGDQILDISKEAKDKLKKAKILKKEITEKNEFDDIF